MCPFPSVARRWYTVDDWIISLLLTVAILYSQGFSALSKLTTDNSQSRVEHKIIHVRRDHSQQLAFGAVDSIAGLRIPTATTAPIDHPSNQTGGKVRKGLKRDSLRHIMMQPPSDRPPASVVVLAAVRAMSSITSFISSPVVAEHSA